jgi:hypothetical protein
MTRKLAVIAVVIVLGVGVDLLAGAEPVGFGAGIGLVGTLLLTFGSKALAAGIKRPADYYDHEDLPRPSATEVADG